MLARRILVVSFIFVMVASFAAADLKVVKQTHRDGFSMMGQTQPAEDSEQTTWIGDDRMIMNQGDTATIVRLDTNKLYVVNHSTQTFNVLDLPIDLTSLVPPEMKPMLDMMKFEVTVTPVDEHKQVGDWNARRYDMTMSSSMFTMKSTMWVATVPGYDPVTFQKMYVQLNSLQPGMADVVDEMRKIDGLVVEQQSVMTMMGNEVGTSEKTISIEDVDAPAGTYDPPAGYNEKPFNFMERMQAGR